MLKFKMLTMFSFQVKPLPPQKVLNRPVLIKQNNQTIISFFLNQIWALQSRTKSAFNSLYLSSKKMQFNPFFILVILIQNNTKYLY